MPSLTYHGEPGRVYPSLGLEPVPGESYDVEADPEDGRWSPADGSPPPVQAEPEPAPESTPEPVTTEPTPNMEA